MISVNGWAIYAHPALLDQLERLAAAVEAEKAKDPVRSSRSANAKVLAAACRLIFDIVPGDPTRPDYRQGDTLGRSRRHWFRAKFGNGRFRLFFRYDSRAKVLIFAWMNDETTLRTYGSRTDAYAVFGTMLAAGDPPDDWSGLLAAASAPSARARLSDAKPE